MGMNNDAEDLKSWINNELPNDGEWQFSSNSDIFVGHAMTMLAYGISVTHIKSILQGLYSAVADEFGTYYHKPHHFN